MSGMDTTTWELNEPGGWAQPPGGSILIHIIRIKVHTHFGEYSFNSFIINHSILPNREGYETSQPMPDMVVSP